MAANASPEVMLSFVNTRPGGRLSCNRKVMNSGCRWNANVEDDSGRSPPRSSASQQQIFSWSSCKPPITNRPAEGRPAAQGAAPHRPPNVIRHLEVTWGCKSYLHQNHFITQ